MRDVAERAGVSVTSVSHVINETRPVSDELRARVLAVMDELGYQPNRLARSLRSGKSHTIGVIVPDNANPFFSEIIHGIEDTGFEHGYSLILCISDADLVKEAHYIDVLVEKQVDGILFMAAGASICQIQSLQERQVPVVVVDREVPDVAVDTVLADNTRGGWLATRHLIELGHRRIACIAAPRELPLSTERENGYRQALREAGMVVDQSLIKAGDFDFESGYLVVKELLNTGYPPSAVFACNDVMAVGAICAAAASGRQVPDNLSVVGYDDIVLASYTSPPLTTIIQPSYQMGVVAAKMLLERMNDPSLPPRREMLRTELIIRSSTIGLHAQVAGERELVA